MELLHGTLDLLILRTLIFRAQHGQGIARAIQQTSKKELLVGHGALYPVLQRLEEAAGFRRNRELRRTTARRGSMR